MLSHQVPPSARNDAVGGNNCAVPTRDVDAACGNAPPWNATHPTYCGHDKLGECDGGTCYKVYDFEDAISEYTKMQDQFMASPLINNFNALD